MGDNSVVYWYSSLEKHLCGYCKNPKGNVSHGMWAKILSVEDYQNLIDRGWRRSGSYCYKPLMNEICCPMYTIKCDALNFQLSKSQKKVIKKFNKFLKDGVLNKNTNPQECQDNISEFVHREVPTHVLDKEVVINSDLNCEKDEQDSSQVAAPSVSQVQEAVPSTSSMPKSGLGADPTKPPCKKAKILRLERKKEKLQKKGIVFEKKPATNEQKTLEEFLNDTAPDSKHKIKLVLINTSRRSAEWENLKKLEFELYKKYQTCVHNDPPGKCTMEGFQRFLINSPLQNVRFSRDSELGFGSFHQLYWLDDKLIAVGVIDILPKCISAVYFFYDPDYRDLTLGTYGSLREVEFARTLHRIIPSIDSYYMGFYIHSCPKMRYKGKLSPSYLLCPETYRWISIEKSVAKLEASKYSRLDNNEAVDENSCTSRDVDEIKILCNRKLVQFKQYKRKFGGHDMFDTIGRLIGKKCAKSIIFIADN
ncbi:arginyl-tRNA--protein transferase 1 isoform X1 [Tribolium castaneum]|uniref:arginyl-tRNA--protein transferase 1 isoform X1 n=1 Tax=Tribolium castaneum TaxID=7070 RepID=UPI0000D56B98|nr:PREDICTED: arginyl-tRNA--protein transferase 1 isoform X1 [Tribolium castaneum]|eukprot:XP_968074.1 PREDICTED: arginyl-tRNA--protein transferase 1 isoform X1 [Tribolium castaneum]